MRAVSLGLVAVVAIAVIYMWNSWQGETEPSVESESQAQNSTTAGNEPTVEVSGTETDNTNSSTIAENSERSNTEVLDPPVDTEMMPVEESAANTNQTVVEIPKGGYAVEDSMKYFVTKQERTPGNLGGPPPPPFMVPENAQGERRIEALLPPEPDAPGQ